MNIENYKKVLAQIVANPETWDQTHWHCDTSHCFAGHAQIMSGYEVNAKTAKRDARAWLDLSFHEANYLFGAYRTIEDFKTVLTDGFYNINGFNRDGLDRDGFDHNGFDRHGYSRDGYDCNGFSRDGYNLGGYDYYGYHRNGFNGDGYNRKGFDCNGFDKNGFDCKGFNRNGYDADGYDLDGLDKNNKLRGLI